MPWQKKTDHPECEGIAVVKDGTDELEGCHATEEDADAQIAALYADEEEAASLALPDHPKIPRKKKLPRGPLPRMEDPPPPKKPVRGPSPRMSNSSGTFPISAGGAGGGAGGSSFQLDPSIIEQPAETLEWEGILIVEGVRSTDGREIEEGALDHRELPLPLMMLRADSGNGHAGAALVGQIRRIEKRGNEHWAAGVFDSGEAGMEARRLTMAQTLRWLSADVEPLEPTEIFADGEQLVERMSKGRIIGATMVAFPAFPQAVIVPFGSEIPEATDAGRPEPEPLLAAICEPCELPPKAWFQEPAECTEPCGLTITADGRIYGFAATWGTCHIGREDICLTPPSSPSRYAYFHTGAVKTQEGALIPCGSITLDTGHASLKADHRSAAAHYDHTGAAVADVVCGENEHGIWIAGAVRPGMEEKAKTLQASAISGDWRRIGGSLELVALLAVNVPGFPIPRAAVASGEQLALVAAGIQAPGQPPAEPEPWRAELAAMREEIAILRGLMGTLAPEIRDRILAELG